MSNKLSIVQFIHPGGEHSPDFGDHKCWNKKQHKRKFMKTSGEYISDRKTLKSDIEFWGEWEPESEVIARIPDPIKEGPSYIYRPFCVLPKKYENNNLQNTDPFVFGDRFLYSICQQQTVNGPTGMQTLDRGSLILFGACKQEQFHLDTVFVVSHWIDHDQDTFNTLLKDVVPDTYLAVSILPWYSQPISYANRLYFGATISEPVGDMYSFFPCLPYVPGTKGFARPIIQIPDIVKDNLSQSRKVSPRGNINDVKCIWDMVVEQVKNAGLSLGVHADLPECIKDNE